MDPMLAMLAYPAQEASSRAADLLFDTRENLIQTTCRHLA
jgi:hypothetical protein